MSHNVLTSAKTDRQTCSQNSVDTMVDDSVQEDRFVANINTNSTNTNSGVFDKDIEEKAATLVKQLFDSVKSYDEVEVLPIKGFIVALGSNSHASLSLQMARKELECYATQGVWSSEFINPDYTATENQPKPDYTNQCGFLTFSDDNNHYVIENVIDYCKSIEAEVEHKTKQSLDIQSKLETTTELSLNKQLSYREVLIDIDVLAVNTEDGLIALKKRYPFKQHEWVGIIELFNTSAFG